MYITVVGITAVIIHLSVSFFCSLIGRVVLACVGRRRKTQINANKSAKRRQTENKRSQVKKRKLARGVTAKRRKKGRESRSGCVSTAGKRCKCGWTSVGE